MNGDFVGNVGAAEGSAVDAEVTGYVGGKQGDPVGADVDAFDAGYPAGTGVDVAFELGEDFGCKLLMSEEGCSRVNLVREIED